MARKQQSILIVEDEPSIADVEAQIVAELGFEFRIACTVNEGTRLVSQESFGMVLLDFKLPDGHSWPVLEAAQNSFRRVPVILVTAMGDERVAAEAVRRGASDYILKSGDFWEELPHAIERV